MNIKTRKRLVRILLIPVISLLILIMAAIAILYAGQQRLVGLAVTQLNKQLPGELQVEGSDISVFQNFPYISIALKNVRFYSGKLNTTQLTATQSDTANSDSAKPIFQAERIFVGFSLPDILKQEIPRKSHRAEERPPRPHKGMTAAS